MANFARDKEYILKQLAMAKETLTKLRALTETDATDSFNGQNGDFSGMESVNGWDDYKHDSDERSSGLGMESPHSDYRKNGANFMNDKPIIARDSLVKVLGLQVSKLEDDLKGSLLAYFEQTEAQKEELISSFETMHAQLSKHHEICQEHHRETAEKDACIERLKVDKHTLERDVENLKRENMQLKTDKTRTSENGYRLSPGFVEPDELSETLMKENSRLREKLRKYETNDYARMERKIALQEKLCESYNKDVTSKDSLLKRLKAENRGLHEDMKNLQDEVLRVNAKRLNAEQDKTKLQQELQFGEEQICTLRERLSSSAEERRILQRCINEGNLKPNISGVNFSGLSELEKEISELRGKCESYRDKLSDKERFLESVTKENEGLSRAVEAMKRELAAIKGEERSLKIENERLQRENADREIDRLSSETTTEANSNKISKIKQQVYDLEGKVSELELQRQQNEDRESELSQEMLANLEKYTELEQQLYLTKKELVQMQGFYDSSEEKRRDLETEAENCRQIIASLERQLQENKMGKGEERMSDVMKENEELNKENERLREEFQTSKTEVKELEEALQSAREQNSLQRMRLDAHDTLMKRKDERIKELQNELLVLHNEFDSLTDEILKKNREMEGLRMSKRLIEQELGLLKSGKLPAKAVYREVTAADPASPDSGFSETEREKAIDRLRRDICSHPQQPVLYEETVSTDEVKKSHAELALATRRLKETERRLAEVIAENERLKDEEHEARTLQLQMDEELLKVTEEYKEVKENERMLILALEESQRFSPQVEVTESLESPLEVDNLYLLAIDEPLVEKSILQRGLLETIPENAVDFAENKQEESLIDFVDAPNVLNSELPQGEIYQPQSKTEELEGQIHSYETRLAKLSAENKHLLRELTNTQEMLKKNKDKTVQENREKLQEKTEHMEEKIHDYEARLAEVNTENEKLLLEMESECKVSEEKRKELQNKTENLEGNIHFLEAGLENKSTENEELLAELKHAQEKLQRMEEGKVVQGNNEDLQNKTEELEEKLFHYETSLVKVNAEKEELLTELAHARQNLKEIESKCQAEQENREELQKIMQEELSAKDDEVAKLQKELSVVCTEQERLEALVESSKETSTRAEEQAIRAQNTILEFERQQGNSRTKEKSLQELLHQSEESNANLQVQLGETEQAYRKLDKEAKALQQQIKLVQQESAELQYEVEELRERVAEDEEKQKKAVESLEYLKTENEHLRQQIEDAEQALENSHQENEKTVLQLEDAIREKDNDIEQLQEELAISEKRYNEIKSLSSNTKTELTDLQAELIESREQFYTTSQEKARLLHDQKELEHDVAEKDEKIAALEMEKNEDKRTISVQEKKVEELVDKLEDYENEATILSEENESLKNSLEEAAYNKKELEDLLAESNEETKALEQQLLAAHESITDLETAFERGEDKNLQNEENLRAAKDQIVKQETQLEARQDEYRALEKDYNETERELEKTQETLDSCQGKITTLEKKLRDAKDHISELEMARDNGLSNEQLLQQKFVNARENIEKTEAENNELKEKLTKLEKKMGDLSSKQEALADRKEELDKVNKELRKELEYEREKRLALKQKVETKDRENDSIQRKVQMLEKNIAEHEDLQNKAMEEKSKLRDELTRAKKNVSELEAAKENQEESMSEMEDLLRDTRTKMATLEQTTEDTLRDNEDLHEELEELNRKLKYTKEENSELEKRLQKQKEITDGFRSNLSERDENVMNSNYNREVAERGLQSLKKDLARKDAKLKMQKEQIEDMEGEAEKAGRKLKETESSNKKLSSENERLLKELADIKAKLAKSDAMLKEKGNAASESDVPVFRVSEVHATPIKAEKLIRDWSDKLSTAQIKVTDLENELLKDIKKHEAKVHRTRPVSQELRRKSADNVSTDHGRPSRFRSRQRPSTSRDSSVDSLRSTQSMLDYLDERIVDENLLSPGATVGPGSVSGMAGEPRSSFVSESAAPVTSETTTPVLSETATPVASENTTPMVSETATPVLSETATPVVSESVTPVVSETATPVPSEPGSPVAAGNGSPVYSDAEDTTGIPVTTLAQAKSTHAPIETLGTTTDVEFTSKQGVRRREASETHSNGKDDNLIDWKLEKILEPRVDYQQPLFAKTPLVPSAKTISPNKAEDPVDMKIDEPNLHTDYQHPVFTEDPQRFDVKSENVLDLRNKYQQPLLDEPHSVPETSPDIGEDLADTKIPDLKSIFQQPASRTGDVTELQSIYFQPSSPHQLQTESHFESKTENAAENQLNYPQPTTMKPSSDELQDIYQPSSYPGQAENLFDAKTEELPELQPDYQQSLLIEPPSDDLFQFAFIPSDNSSSVTTVTDLTFQSTSPVFPEHTLLVAFDPLDIPEPQPHSREEDEQLDPFEQLMRDARNGDSKDFDIDDIIIDVTDDITNDDVNNDITASLISDLQIKGTTTDNGHSKSEPMKNSNIDHVMDGGTGDVIDSPQQIKPFPSPGESHVDVIDSPKPVEPIPPLRKLKEKMTPVLFPRGDRKEKESGTKMNEISDIKPYSVMIMVDDEIVQTHSPEKELKTGNSVKKKPTRPPKPAVLPEFSNVGGNEVYKSPNQIRKELEDVQTSSDKNLNSAHEGKKKPNRPPKPVVPSEFADKEGEETYKSPSQVKKQLEEENNSRVADNRRKKPERPPKPVVPAAFASLDDEDSYKSPSQIRKELEEASKKGQRTIIAAKPVERQQKTHVTENRPAQYYIEEKRKESGVDHAHGTKEGDHEEEEEMGKGRLLKLIAAFENK